MAQGKFTDKQVERIRKLEDFRMAKGLPGYEDFFELILASLLENEGLTEDDLDNFQTEQKNMTAQESFDELLNARRYEYVNGGFTEANWPLEPVEPDEDEWEVSEYQFPESLTVEQGLGLLQEMADSGEIRLSTGSRRALKWIAEHPDKQTEYPIILPLCRKVLPGWSAVPFFGHGKIWGGTGRQRLHLYKLDERVFLTHRWLILRKKTTATTTQESFADLLYACFKQEDVDADFIEARWPLEPVEPNEDDWEVAEHNFGAMITLTQGRRLLEEMAARGEIRLLTGSRRAMKWIVEHPEVPMDHAVILPLQVRVGFSEKGFFGMPVFYKNYLGRPSLNLHNSNNLAYQTCCWLVLRKKAVATTKESFAELLAACNLVNNAGVGFNETDWPLEPVEPDEDDWEVCLYHFPDQVTFEAGLNRLKQMAARGEIRLLTGSRRAMKWIAMHPDAQLDHPIILPLYGREWVGIFPVFIDNHNRNLTLHRSMDEVGLDCGWLVLREKPLF